MFTAKKVYAMLENESLWETATQCHQILAAARIPHAVMGGVAVCLHGYQRNTVDVDLLVRKNVRVTLRQSGTSPDDPVANPPQPSVVPTTVGVHEVRSEKAS